MNTHLLLLSALSLIPAMLPAAEAIFGIDGKRVWMTGVEPGSIGYFDVGDREGTEATARTLDVAHAGGPQNINGLAISKKGNLLLAAPDAVWAFDPSAMKAVKVAALPAEFSATDLAYQESTGAILVWGWFLKPDHRVDRFAAWRIGKGEAKPLPVFTGGLDSFETAAFDAAGRMYLGAGADLWAGDLAATEHEQAGEFDWQLPAFRIAALGTPVAGEGSDAGQRITGLAAGGGKLVVTVGNTEGSTLLRLPVPAFSRHEEGQLNVQVPLATRWAFQQKIIASTQPITGLLALPRDPIVAVSGDGARVVYQTAAEGLRRWWLLEKSPKPRLLSEESD